MQDYFHSEEVASVFNNYPAEILPKLLELRELILRVGHKIPAVGAIIETLKWGEPSYLPKNKNIGTTVRINVLKNQKQYGIYFNCNTTLVDSFKEMHPTIFKYIGNRGIIFNINEEIDCKALADCIEMAFCYHLKK